MSNDLPSDSVLFSSLASYGEDSLVFGILTRLHHITGLNTFEKNTYMDIGCYHPVYESTTYFLYAFGWRGTLIDPNPILKEEIVKYRDDDFFIEAAVDKDSGEKIFYIFNDINTSNTLSESFAEKISKQMNKQITKRIKVKTITIDDAIDQHIKFFGSCPQIINIDIEGLDYDVITSYSFKHRPTFILIEDEILGAFNNSKIREFMENKDYTPIASNFLTTIYIDKKSKYYEYIFKFGMN